MEGSSTHFSPPKEESAEYKWEKQKGRNIREQKIIKEEMEKTRLS